MLIINRLVLEPGWPEWSKMPRLLWNMWMYLQFYSVKEPSKNHDIWVRLLIGSLWGSVWFGFLHIFFQFASVHFAGFRFFPISNFYPNFQHCPLSRTNQVGWVKKWSGTLTLSSQLSQTPVISLLHLLQTKVDFLIFKFLTAAPSITFQLFCICDLCLGMTQSTS